MIGLFEYIVLVILVCVGVAFDVYTTLKYVCGGITELNPLGRRGSVVVKPIIIAVLLVLGFQYVVALIYLAFVAGVWYVCGLHNFILYHTVTKAKSHSYLLDNTDVPILPIEITTRLKP